MVKDILKLIPIVQSVAVLKDNIEFTDKPSRNTKDFLRQGIKNVIGVSLIKTTSNFID
jgi:hypothetical protein